MIRARRPGEAGRNGTNQALIGRSATSRRKAGPVTPAQAGRLRSIDPAKTVRLGRAGGAPFCFADPVDDHYDGSTLPLRQLCGHGPHEMEQSVIE